MPPHDLTADEVEALGRLLQGQSAGSLRASVRLVKRGLCIWREKDNGESDVALSPEGLRAARELWPGVAVAVAAEASPVAPAPGPVTRQIQLDLIARVQAPRHPAVEAVARLIGDDALAEIVVEHYPQGRGLSTASRRGLQALGLSPHQSETVAAAFALARACRGAGDRGQPLESHEAMARLVWEAQDVADLETEHLWVVGLDTARRVLSVTAAAKGNLNKVDVALRDVFTPLARCRAAACFIAHNHPSGDLRWSDADAKLTQRVAHGARSLGIEFLDHLVLSPSGAYVSLEEEGLL